VWSSWPTPTTASLGQQGSAGTGFNDDVTAVWRTPPNQLLSGTFNLCVIGYHQSETNPTNPLAKVAFFLDSGSEGDVTSPNVTETWNAGTSQEYCVQASDSALADGGHEVRAIAYPIRGYPRLLSSLHTGTTVATGGLSAAPGGVSLQAHDQRSFKIIQITASADANYPVGSRWCVQGAKMTPGFFQLDAFFGRYRYGDWGQPPFGCNETPTSPAGAGNSVTWTQLYGGLQESWTTADESLFFYTNHNGTLTVSSPNLYAEQPSGGNDSFACTSTGSPCATIQGAMGKLSTAGSTCNFNSGTSATNFTACGSWPVNQAVLLSNLSLSATSYTGNGTSGTISWSPPNWTMGTTNQNAVIPTGFGVGFMNYMPFAITASTPTSVTFATPTASQMLKATAAWTTSSNTISIPSGSSIPHAGQLVYDQTTGQTIGAVSSYSGTTVTPTGNAAHASSGSADVLHFENTPWTGTLTASAAFYSRTTPATASWTTSNSTISIASGLTNINAGQSVYDNTVGATIGTVQNYAGTTLTLTANTASASSGSTDSLTIGNTTISIPTASQVAPGETVTDNTTSQSVGTVASVAGTTLTLTAIAAHGSSGSGDTLAFTISPGNVVEQNSNASFAPFQVGRPYWPVSSSGGTITLALEPGGAAQAFTGGSGSVNIAPDYSFWTMNLMCPSGCGSPSTYASVSSNNVGLNNNVFGWFTVAPASGLTHSNVAINSWTSFAKIAAKLHVMNDIALDSFPCNACTADEGIQDTWFDSMNFGLASSGDPLVASPTNDGLFANASGWRILTNTTTNSDSVAGFSAQDGITIAIGNTITNPSTSGYGMVESLRLGNQEIGMGSTSTVPVQLSTTAGAGSTTFSVNTASGFTLPPAMTAANLASCLVPAFSGAG
jgi:hypothetical protein